MTQKSSQSLIRILCFWLVYKILASVCPPVQVVWVIAVVPGMASRFGDACLLLRVQASSRWLSHLPQKEHFSWALGLNMNQREHSDSSSMGFSCLRTLGAANCQWVRRLPGQPANCSFWYVSSASGPRGVRKELQLREGRFSPFPDVYRKTSWCESFSTHPRREIWDS